MIADHGLRNPADAKAIARHEVLCSLDDILRESMRFCRIRGRFLYDTPSIQADGDYD